MNDRDRYAKRLAESVRDAFKAWLVTNMVASGIVDKRLVEEEFHKFMMQWLPRWVKIKWPSDEEDHPMPSKTPAQKRTMRAAAHDAAFARKMGIKQSVAREYEAADKAKAAARSKKGRR